MILFLHGEDTYRSKKKLGDIRAKFLRDVDPTGLNLIELETPELPALLAAVGASPFLAKKRMVILKNAIRAGGKKGGEALRGIFERVPEETILVIHEDSSGEDLDGSPAFAAVRDTKFYPEFLPPDRRTLSQWISQEAKAHGAAFTADGMQTYLAAAPLDGWALASSLDLLAARAASLGSPITPDIVREMTAAEAEESIFDFLDAVGTRRASRAAALLERLLEQGENEISLLSRLQGHMRSLLVASDLAAAGELSKERLVRELGVHSFVASKIASQSRYFRLAELQAMYDRLIEADKRLKTGYWSAPRLPLDLFLLTLEPAA